jgi:hypothetical protein
MSYADSGKLAGGSSGRVHHGSGAAMKPPTDAEKFENLKMWLTEQIQRYQSLAKRSKGTDEIAFNAIAGVLKVVLARLTEDEKC